MSHQYGLIGEVLLATLGELLKEEWAPKVQESRLNIYCVMISVMIPVTIEEEIKKFGK